MHSLYTHTHTHTHIHNSQEDQLPGLSDEELQRLEQQLRKEQTRRQQEAIARVEKETRERVEMEMRASMEQVFRAKMAAEQEKRDEERQCAICLDADKNCAFNCGHQSCLGCAETL